MSTAPPPSPRSPGIGGVDGAPSGTPVADPVRSSRAATGANGAAPRRGSVLSSVIGAHAVVDYYSFIVVALLPLLATRLDLSNQQKAYVLAAGSVMSGFIQPLVAWIGDRLNTRLIATIGLVVAAGACSTIGLAQNFTQLLVLSAIGAAGVGAFHPPAAAVVGQLSGSRRSLGVSLFFVAGMGGGMAGNVLAPYSISWLGHLAGGTGEAGLALGLQWQSALVIPGVLVGVVLARAIHDAPHRRSGAHADHAALAPRERTLRWRAVWLLYAMSVTRFIVNTALVYLFLRWIETIAADRAGQAATGASVGIAASVLNGKFQAAMQLGMGGAGLAAGWLLRVHHEKASLVLVPLVGAVAIATVPLVDDIGLSHAGLIGVGLVLATLAGVGFGGTVPTVIALAQRLLPHRTALASGLMMGGAWGVGFLGPPLAEGLESRVSLEAAFFATAGLLVVCASLSLLLPGRLLREA